MDKIECVSFLGGTRFLPKSKFVFRPAVYGIIQHKTQILVVNTRRTGKLYLPGGGVEIGESLVNALAREVLEETGLQVKVNRFLGFEEGLFYYDPLDEAFHSLLFFYHCTPLSFDLLSNDEIDDAEAIDPCWVEPNRLTPHSFQSHGEPIIKFLQEIGLK